jgi:ABC-2 type transport system ATP-binding protein
MKSLKTSENYISEQKEEEMDKENAVEIVGLTKKFKTKQKEAGLFGSFKSIFKPKFKEIVAVDGISFNIKRGELVAFIGPNGAGKSTTIKILAGILHPDSGNADVAGKTPWKDRRKLAYSIGSVFGQKPQLWYHLPAIDTFNLLSQIYDLDQKEYKKRLNYLVNLFEIKDIINVPVRKLSLGQRMRCEIVGSLIHKPEIIFLDEPTIGLDIIAKQKIRELIRELNKKEKVTILLTSHDTQDIEKLCKRIIIINHGKIVYDGDVAKLKSNYLKNKIVSIKFEDPFKGLKLAGVKILSFAEYSVELEINTEIISIKKLIDYIISKYEIADINISGTPIDEVISQVYAKK